MSKKRVFTFAAVMLQIMAFAAPAFSAAPRILRVLTHDSFSATKSVIEEFEKANDVQIQFVTGGDAGETLNRAILTKGDPLADVIYGIDNTFASRALAADILLPYPSPLLGQTPSDLKVDPGNRLLPVDFGYVCPIYDKKFFADKGLAVPTRLEDLALPAYKSLFVVENPATSSPGLAFLLATVAYFQQKGQPAGWETYWQALRKNDVLVANGWNEAYYGEFSVSGKGHRPLVVSYATDPAADISFAEEPKPSEPRVAAIIPPNGAFRQIEFVAILKGTKVPELARKWVDFMLDKRFQEDIPLQMFVYPANPKAELPELFKKFAPVPPQPAVLDPALIGQMRDQWITRWTDIVLK